jgi:hypothetical protein
MTILALLFSITTATCFRSDVQATCCPAACAARQRPKWYQADDVLRGCMRGLGCKDETATVGMMCGCKEPK